MCNNRYQNTHLCYNYQICRNMQKTSDVISLKQLGTIRKNYWHKSKTMKSKKIYDLTVCTFTLTSVLCNIIIIFIWQQWSKRKILTIVTFFFLLFVYCWAMHHMLRKKNRISRKTCYRKHLHQQWYNPYGTQLDSIGWPCLYRVVCSSDRSNIRHCCDF